MTARRPPSLRDPKNYGQRLSNGLRAMSKGSDGGRVLNAGPVAPLAAADATDLDLSPAGDAASEVAFLRDRFPTSGTLSGAASSLALTSVPAANSLHLYLNGLELDEGTDYTLSGSTVTVLSPAGTGAGDVLEARYAYDGVTAAGTPATIWLSDTFDRANSSTLGTADTGQAWIAAQGSASIVSNKATFPSGTVGVEIANAAVSDATYTCTLTTGSGTVDAGLVFRSNVTGTLLLFAQLYNGGSPGLRLASESSGTTAGLALDGTLTILNNHTYVIQVITLGSSITIKVDGVTRITYTLSSTDQTTYGSNTYAGLRIASSDHGTTFDDLLVTA